MAGFNDREMTPAQAFMRNQYSPTTGMRGHEGRAFGPFDITEDEFQTSMDQAMGFSPANILTKMPGGMQVRQILKNVAPEVQAAVREKLRTLVSVANEFADFGPQDLETRMEALKYATGLPNKLSDKLSWLAASRGMDPARLEALKKPLVSALDWADDMGMWMRRGVGARLRVAGRGDPQAYTNKEMAANRERVVPVLRQIAESPDSPINDALFITLDRLRLKPGTRNLSDVAQRMIDIARQEGGMIPDLKLQKEALRWALGHPSKITNQLEKATAKRDALARHDPRWQKANWEVGSLQSSMDWAQKLWDKASKQWLSSGKSWGPPGARGPGLTMEKLAADVSLHPRTRQIATKVLEIVNKEQKGPQLASMRTMALQDALGINRNLSLHSTKMKKKLSKLDPESAEYKQLQQKWSVINDALDWGYKIFEMARKGID